MKKLLQLKFCLLVITTFCNFSYATTPGGSDTNQLTGGSDTIRAAGGSDTVQAMHVSGRNQTRCDSDTTRAAYNEMISRLSRENTTRIYSLVTSVTYIDNESNEEVQVSSEFTPPTSIEGCALFDVENSYTEFFLYELTEITCPNSASNSNWFEGRRLPGRVFRKTITYCFAK